MMIKVPLWNDVEPFQTTLAPISLARSRIFLSPLDWVPATSWNPLPLSSMQINSWFERQSKVILAQVALECFSTLFNASWITR